MAPSLKVVVLACAVSAVFPSGQGASPASETLSELQKHRGQEDAQATEATEAIEATQAPSYQEKTQASQEGEGGGGGGGRKDGGDADADADGKGDDGKGGDGEGSHRQEMQRDLLGGFEAGLSGNESYTARQECRQVLSEMSPLMDFVETTANSCLAMDTPRCVMSFISGIRDMSEYSPDFMRRLEEACPRKVYLLFTAPYDPFLAPEMLTLSALHVGGVYTQVNRLTQAGPGKPYQLGKAIGGLADELMPELRLPLTENQVNSMIKGFISTFEIRPNEQTSDRSLLAGPGLVVVGNASASKPNISEECMSGVRDQVAPANDALRQVAGTLLNQTCFSVDTFGCILQALESVGSFVSMVKKITPVHDEQRQSCPKGFLDAMQQFDDQTTFSMLTNVVVNWSDLQRFTNQALEALYGNRLEEFGQILGIVFLRVSDPTKYGNPEVKWAGLSPMQQKCYLVLVPVALLLGGALLPLCLFRSGCFGRPSKRQEISVRPSSEHANLLIDYNFYGAGPFEVNSEIEFDMVPRPRSSSSPQMSTKCSDSGESSPEMMTMEPNDSEGRKSSKSSGGFQAWEDFGPVASWKGLSEMATERVRLRLTDELPSRGYICAFIVRTLASWFLCDSCGTQRRWEAETSIRMKDGTWMQHDHHDQSWFGSCGKRCMQQSLRMVGLSSDRDYLRTEGRAYDDDDESVFSDEELGLQTKAQLYLNGIQKQGPIKDQPLPISARMSELSAAVIRLKPSDDFRESWDMLFFVATTTQFLTSTLCFLAMCLDLGSVLWGGKLATFWWWGSLMSVSLLSLHKKVHARWWAFTHKDERRGFSGKASCDVLMFNGTTTPVGLFQSAPAVPDAGGDDRCSLVSSASDQRPSRASRRRSEAGWFCRFWTCLVSIPSIVQSWFLQLRSWGLTLLMYLRPFAYTFIAEVKPDDLVRIRTSLWASLASKVLPAQLLPERCHYHGRLGKLVSQPTDGLYRVAFETGGRADASSTSTSSASPSVSASERSAAAAAAPPGAAAADVELGADVDVDVDLEAQLGSGIRSRCLEERLFRREDFELENLYKAGGRAFPCRAGHWHDRLTAQVSKGLVLAFLAVYFWVACHSPEFVADERGYMSLHLVVAKDAPVTKYVTSLMFEIQLGCLGLEMAIRVFTWVVGRCMLAALYRS